MSDDYVHGFTAKCASCGVDAEALIKWAARGDQMAKLIKLLRPLGRRQYRPDWNTTTENVIHAIGPYELGQVLRRNTTDYPLAVHSLAAAMKIDRNLLRGLKLKADAGLI